MKRCIFVVVPAMVVLALAGGCALIQPAVTTESIRPIVEKTFRTYLAERNDRAINVIMEQMKTVAESEIKRLNAAELTYKNEVKEQLILGGHAQQRYYFKAYRVHDSLTVLDIVEDPSVFVSYRVYGGCTFRIFETARYSTMIDDRAFEKAQSETEFVDTGKKAQTVLVYTFDNDMQWNGQPGIVVDTVGLQAGSQGVLQFQKRFDAHWTNRIKMR